MMTTPVYVDQSKIVKCAREMAEVARTHMLASFALLQLDIQTTHQQHWSSISIRLLEDKIDEFKASCQAFRSAQDAIIKAMAMGGDRPDTAVPSPDELTSIRNPLARKIPDGWTTVVQDGIPVLVPVATTPSHE